MPGGLPVSPLAEVNFNEQFERMKAYQVLDASKRNVTSDDIESAKGRIFREWDQGRTGIGGKSSDIAERLLKCTGDAGRGSLAIPDVAALWDAPEEQEPVQDMELPKIIRLEDNLP